MPEPLPGSVGQMSHPLQTMRLILLSVHLRQGEAAVWLTYIVEAKA